MKDLTGISLQTTGRVNGASYTDAEKRLALSISQVVLTATGNRQYEETDSEVISILEEVHEEGNCNCVPAYCRAIYKKIEAQRLQDKTTLLDFPKRSKSGERSPRDWTSVGLLFRHAFEECGFSEKELQEVFPKYKKKLG